MSHVMAQDGLLPPDSRTGFHWLLCSNPGDLEGLAPIGRSEGSCAASDGRRRWQPEARPPGSSVRSPRSWTEPGEQSGERRVREGLVVTNLKCNCVTGWNWDRKKDKSMKIETQSFPLGFLGLIAIMGSISNQNKQMDHLLNVLTIAFNYWHHEPQFCFFCYEQCGFTLWLLFSMASPKAFMYVTSTHDAPVLHFWWFLPKHKLNLRLKVTVKSVLTGK